MRESIHDYARLGIVHHMLFNKCMQDPDYHADTLSALADRADIETLDCFVPFGEGRRNQLIGRMKNCNKEIVYALHAFPLRKISLASSSLHEQAITRLVIQDQIEMAAAIGSTGFVFGSGVDIPDDREAAKIRFGQFCRWFCLELKRRGMDALLEPFDRTIDKKFLLGPVVECIELIRSLEPNIDNLKIELDMAHIPLMGESFPQAIRNASPYLKRVHLGNCVLKDINHPLYGDMHPPIGYGAGEIDVPELAEILEELLSTGYLNKMNRGALVFEITAFPDQNEEYTVQDNMNRLAQAWELV